MAFASEQAIRREAWLHRLGAAAFVAIAAAGAAGVFGHRGAVVFRAMAIYLFLLVVFRIAGRRTLAQTTSFDLVLLLIIGDATQQALLGEDNTMVGGALAVLTLVSLDVTLAHLKRWFPVLDRMVEGEPAVIVADGQPRDEAMSAHVLDAEDVLAAARQIHGLTDLAGIREAVIEKDGKISVVPSRGPMP